MEQNIGILFVAIGLLSASIGILEKNYMFGVDSYVDKFNKKYNVNIDKATYCRFEGIQRIKTAMRLLILEVVYFLFEIKDLKMMIIMIVIYLIIKPIRNAAKTSLKVPPNNIENEPAPKAEKIIITGRG